MKNKWIFLLLSVLVLGCHPSVPSEYIQPDELADILYDYHLAIAMARQDPNTTNTDVTRQKYYYTVLSEHGVTEAMFDSSLVYYYSHVDQLKKIYTRVNDRLSEEAKLYGASVGEIAHYATSTNGDTTNIWREQTSLLLMPKPTLNRYEFSIKADTSFHKGDAFMMQFMTNYLYQSGSKEAILYLRAKYEGDSIIANTTHVTVSGLAQVRIAANNKQKLKELSGFIYLTEASDESNAPKIMFINQLQLIRFRTKETMPVIENDTIKKDSLLPASQLERPIADTVRGRNLEKPARQLLPNARRTAPHRMDALRPKPTKE